jgi:hypothetical protein
VTHKIISPKKSVKILDIGVEENSPGIMGRSQEPIFSKDPYGLKSNGSQHLRSKSWNLPCQACPGGDENKGPRDVNVSVRDSIINDTILFSNPATDEKFKHLETTQKNLNRVRPNFKYSPRGDSTVPNNNDISSIDISGIKTTDKKSRAPDMPQLKLPLTESRHRDTVRSSKDLLKASEDLRNSYRLSHYLDTKESPRRERDPVKSGLIEKSGIPLVQKGRAFRKGEPYKRRYEIGRDRGTSGSRTPVKITRGPQRASIRNKTTGLRVDTDENSKVHIDNSYYNIKELIETPASILKNAQTSPLDLMRRGSYSNPVFIDSFGPNNKNKSTRETTILYSHKFEVSFLAKLNKIFPNRNLPVVSLITSHRLIPKISNMKIFKRTRISDSPGKTIQSFDARELSTLLSAS